MQKHEDWLGEQLPKWEREGLIDAVAVYRVYRGSILLTDLQVVAP